MPPSATYIVRIEESTAPRAIAIEDFLGEAVGNEINAFEIVSRPTDAKVASAFSHFSVTVDGTTFEGCTHSDPSKIIALIVRDIEHRTFLLRICAKTASLKDIESQFTTNIATVSTLALEIHRFIAQIRDPRSGHTQASLFTHNEFARGMINALYIVNGGGEHNCPEVAECYSKLNDAMAFVIASHPNYC